MNKKEKESILKDALINSKEVKDEIIRERLNEIVNVYLINPTLLYMEDEIEGLSNDEISEKLTQDILETIESIGVKDYANGTVLNILQVSAYLFLDYIISECVK